MTKVIKEEDKLNSYWSFLLEIIEQKWELEKWQIIKEWKYVYS